MNRPDPAITLDVNAANPGQFLACCGLLELASHLDPETLGWFDDGCFCVATGRPDTLDRFLEAEIAPIGDGRAPADKPPASPPVTVRGDFGDLRLDWWEDESATQAGFKTWAGGQTVMGFFERLRQNIVAIRHDLADRELLTDARPVKDLKPVYFDSRLSRLTSLDMGFSTEAFKAAFSPSAELFALVGLQRFRPATVQARERYRYATWAAPLPVAVAAAAAHTLIPTLIEREYVFPLVVRTGDKYKAFGPAEPQRSQHV